MERRLESGLNRDVCEREPGRGDQVVGPLGAHVPEIGYGRLAQMLAEQPAQVLRRDPCARGELASPGEARVLAVDRVERGADRARRGLAGDASRGRLREPDRAEGLEQHGAAQAGELLARRPARIGTERERLRAELTDRRRRVNHLPAHDAEPLGDFRLERRLNDLAPAVVRLAVARESESLAVKRREEDRFALAHVVANSVDPDRGLPAPDVDELQVVLDTRTERSAGRVANLVHAQRALRRPDVHYGQDARIGRAGQAVDRAEAP